MKFSRVFSVICLLLPGVLSAQDYSAAFEKLLNLGFPDTKGAQYVMVKFDNEYAIPGSQRYRETKPDRSGNAWLFPRKEGQHAAVEEAICNGCLRLKLAGKAKGGFLSGLFRSKKKTPPPGTHQARWKKADLVKDAQKLIKQFDGLGPASRVLSEDYWGYDETGAQFCSELMMFACHLHRAGEKDLANKLAAKVMKEAPAPHRVIDLIIQQMAEDQYRTVYADFQKNQDWQGYLKGLRQLQRKYPRGWKTHSGLEILIPKVEQRVKETAPVLKYPKGTEPHDPTRKILDSLLIQKEVINLSVPPAWLLKSSEKSRRYAEPSPWLKDVFASGLQSFPDLLATAADETLLLASLQVNQRYGHYSGSIHLSSDNEVSAAETVYRSMSRPATRGEVVRAILKQAIPDPEKEFENASPEDFQALALAWWQRHREATPGKIAKNYLQSGNRSMSQRAIDILIKSGQEDSFKLIESYFLNAEYLSNEIPQLESYLKTRRGKATGFFKEISEQIRAEGENSRSFYSNGDRVDAETAIKNLSVLVSDVKPEELIAQIKSGKTEAKTGMDQLKSVLDAQKRSEQLGELIAMAGGLPKLTDRLIILEELTGWTDADYAAQEDEEKQKTYLDSLQAHLKNSSATWKQILSSTESFTPEQRTQFYGAPSPAVFSSWAIQAIHFPNYNNGLSQLGVILSNKDLWDFYRKKAEAILEKGENTSFPSADKVTEEERKNIRQKLSSMSAAEIISFRDSSSLSIRLAWPKVMEEYGDEFPGSVAKLASFCHSIDTSNTSHLSDVQESQIREIFYGKQITQEMLAQALKFMESLEEGDSNLVIALRPGASPASGVGVSLWKGDNFLTWKKNVLGEKMDKLKADSPKQLVAMAAYGLEEDSREADTVVRFIPALNAQEEESGTKALIKKALPIFKVRKEKAPRRQQVNILTHFYSEEGSEDE